MGIMRYEMIAGREQYKKGIANAISESGDNVGMCTIPLPGYDSKGLISYWKRKITGKLVYVKRGR